jgi:hypothetical protein
MAFAFSTTPGIGVGTISIARNSTTVTGVGTNFTSPSLLNQIILVNGFNSRVTAVASATSMTINRVPSFEITGDTFSFVTAATVINQTGADTDPSGLSALLGVNTYRVGIQAVYDLGVLRLALTGAAAVFSYDANRHCIVWSNQVSAIELTIGSGRTLTITGARTDGTYTAPFYPRALAMPRVLPAGDSTYLPSHRSLVNSGILNISGIWFDTNQVADLGGTATITDCKWSATDQQANFRMSAANITINGLDLHNMPLTLLQSAALGALNGLRFFNSGYTPVSLPAVAPSNPRIYTDWNFQGSLPLMNNFGSGANYVEFRNFGDWTGFRLATNSAVNMAARFVKNVSVDVIDTSGAGVTDAIVYRLDTNNGSRVTYTADEHFIQTTVNGVATGRILALVGRLPAGAANNSTQYTAFMDCRNATNDQTGDDILRFVSYEHSIESRNINTKGNFLLSLEQRLFDDVNVSLSKVEAVALVGVKFEVDHVNKKIKAIGSGNIDNVLYDASKAFKATNNPLNLSLPTLDELLVTAKGSILEIAEDWHLEIGAGVNLTKGTKFKEVVLNGTGLLTFATATQTVPIGTIDFPFTDALGSRVAITNLDPENFGVTWNVRYKKVSETSWTTISGTGNSTVILTDNDEYQLQARVAGYTWKEVEFDTNKSLLVDLALQYHVADDGTPQYLKPYNIVLANMFEYDATEQEIKVTNTNGSILQPGFPELYRVIEKVQQDPTLVWQWINPVTSNSTSQKILIPPTSTLKMFLSVDSDASVKITCPVVYSDTGISADDRVKGNPAGFSIILGSSATADSSLIVSQLVEQLGGLGYDTNNNSLVKVSEDLEIINNGVKKASLIIPHTTDL